MRIPARFNGKCAACQRAILPGEMIEWRKGATRGRRAVCAACADANRAPAPAAPAPAAPAPAAHPGKVPHYVGHFDNALAIADSTPESGRDYDTATAGKESFADAVDRLRNGDNRPEAVDAIEEGRRAGADAARPIVEAAAWCIDYAGATPSMPHAVAGAPRSMRRPTRRADESAPIIIWADISAVWTTTEADMLRRGGALAGLVDAIAAVRPVELRLCCVGRSAVGTKTSSVHTWRADPRDPARLAAQLGQSMYRGVLIRWTMAVFGENRTRLDHDEDYARKALGAAPQDIVITPMIRERGGLADAVAQLKRLAGIA